VAGTGSAGCRLERQLPWQGPDRDKGVAGFALPRQRVQPVAGPRQRAEFQAWARQWARPAVGGMGLLAVALIGKADAVG
jgi:hypothetical protein